MSETGESSSPSRAQGDEGERQPTDPALHPDFDALVTKAFTEPSAPVGLEQGEADGDGDIEDLSDGTDEAPPISIEDLDSLWTAFLKLEEWIFLVQPVPGRDPFPFIGKLEDQLWLFLFTDHERLRRFADARGMLDPELNAYFITMSPEQSLEWLARLYAGQQNSEGGADQVNPDASPQSHVYGVRVNEGPHGWYAPLESLPVIHGHLKELGRI